MTVRWALLDGGLTVQVKDGAERIFMTRQEAVQLARELLGNLGEPGMTCPTHGTEMWALLKGAKAECMDCLVGNLEGG